ncbi:MAG: GTP-binding protein [Promethearchaeia archaeon]
MQKFDNLKILVVGASKSGKTALFRNLGVLAKHIESEKGKQIQLYKYSTEIGKFNYVFHLWDFKDISEFSDIYKQSFEGAMGVISVFDLSRPQTLNKAKTYLKVIEDSLGKLPPFILIGNKVDLVYNIYNVIDRKKIIDYAKNNGGIYIEASLQDLSNIKVALQKLLLEKMG